MMSPEKKILFYFSEMTDYLLTIILPINNFCSDSDFTDFYQIGRQMLLSKGERASCYVCLIAQNK